MIGRIKCLYKIAEKMEIYHSTISKSLKNLQMQKIQEDRENYKKYCLIN